MYCKCSNSQIHSVWEQSAQQWQKLAWRKTYNHQGIHYNSIYMWTFLFIHHLVDLVDNIGLQSKFLDPIKYTHHIEQSIDEQDCPIRKGRHFGESHFHCQMTNLWCDCEEELGSLCHFTLNPYVALHKIDEMFRDGKAKAGSSIFLFEKVCFRNDRK